MEDIVSHASPTRRRARPSTLPVYVIMLFTIVVWLGIHYFLTMRWTPGNQMLLNAVVVLITLLIVLFFSLASSEDEPMKDIGTLMTVVVVLGIAASWLASNPGGWRIVGAFLIACENGVVIARFTQEKARRRIRISVLLFVPIVLLGILGIAELFGFSLPF